MYSNMQGRHSNQCHGTGCFFALPRKSVHKLVHILGAPKKHPQIPDVALVDFTPDWRQCRCVSLSKWPMLCKYTYRETTF